MTYLGPITTLSPSATLPAPADNSVREKTTAIMAVVDATREKPPFVERRRQNRRQERRDPLVETRQGGDRRRGSDAVHIDIIV